MLLIVSAVSKSSQFTLHTWLIGSMAGPTPVSALLHSSTMVVLGIYLLIRLSPILEWSSDWSIYLIFIASLSALLGASCGLVENDIKKIIAYSTTSQLGYMMIACCLSLYNIAIFHIIIHAFFKSLLFLAAGAIIHSLFDNQDIRKYGSLIKFLPITYIVFLLASLSLIAFPFFSGFYSKDYLITLLIVPYNFTHTLGFLFTFLAAIFTSIYSIRSLLLIFISQPNFPLNRA
ncbi:NADH:ubiquinone oxidoreductase subunit 5 [Batrachochytrium dendrobatidis]|nr:NADH:ubiquinone oxidoreductase subunit 5 [Batrachochytrium dendrobatidis]KAK5670172.1 NADH:ubiquinone oxidoreductase subunit 5 [Batrachochytrium dendrobatidis]